MDQQNLEFITAAKQEQSGGDFFRHAIIVDELEMDLHHEGHEEHEVACLELRAFVVERNFQIIDRAGSALPGNKPCRLRNSIMKRSNSHGCSIWQAWPAP